MKKESSRQTWIRQTDRQMEISIPRAPVGAKNISNIETNKKCTFKCRMVAIQWVTPFSKSWGNGINLLKYVLKYKSPFWFCIFFCSWGILNPVDVDSPIKIDWKITTMAHADFTINNNHLKRWLYHQMIQVEVSSLLHHLN